MKSCRYPKKSIRQIDRIKVKEFLETRKTINLPIDKFIVILRDRYIFSSRIHK